MVFGSNDRNKLKVGDWNQLASFSDITKGSFLQFLKSRASRRNNTHNSCDLATHLLDIGPLTPPIASTSFSPILSPSQVPPPVQGLHPSRRQPLPLRPAALLRPADPAALPAGPAGRLERRLAFRDGQPPGGAAQGLLIHFLQVPILTLLLLHAFIFASATFFFFFFFF